MRSSAFHPWVWDAARAQWDSGNHAEAVDAAARNINSRLQKRVGRNDIGEGKLAREAFSPDSPRPGQARLRIMPDDGGETYKSIQAGVASFGAGCFMAIRDPLAHLPDDEIDLSEQDALERLAALSLFARWINDATVET